MRTPHRARVLNTGRVNVIGIRSEAPPRQSRRPSVSIERKQRIMDMLIDEPLGIRSAELAAELDLRVNVVRLLCNELREEGRVSLLGNMYWIADV